MGEIGVEINLICWLLSSLLVWVMEESRCYHLSLNKDASACVVVLGTCRLVPGHAGGFSHLGFWPLGKWSWVGRGGGSELIPACFAELVWKGLVENRCSV